MAMGMSVLPSSNSSKTREQSFVLIVMSIIFTTHFFFNSVLTLQNELNS